MKITRRRFLAAILVSITTCGGLAACGSNNFRDVEGVRSRNPQKIETYNNVDKHPNIVRLCIDGVAILTTTRQYEPVTLVPAWDAWCKS